MKLGKLHLSIDANISTNARKIQASINQLFSGYLLFAFMVICMVVLLVVLIVVVIAILIIMGTSIKKILDGVGPVDNRPSTDKLYHFFRKKKKKKKMGHVTRDT